MAELHVVSALLNKGAELPAWWASSSNSWRRSGQIWRISTRRCGWSIPISGRRRSVPISSGREVPGSSRASVSGGSYAELHNAAQPTIRELAEQIMRAKAIPAGDDRSHDSADNRRSVLIITARLLKRFMEPQSLAA
jgi:hypothetical protein